MTLWQVPSVQAFFPHWRGSVQGAPTGRIGVHKEALESQ